MLISVAVFIMVFLALNAGCRCVCRTTAQVREEGAATGPIEVKKGSEFSVGLDSNPTTGYSWRLACPLDGSVVALVGSEYERRGTPRIGAGGEEVWTFRAVGWGKTGIEFEYSRPWEKDRPPAEKKTFEVTVR